MVKNAFFTTLFIVFLNLANTSSAQMPILHFDQPYESFNFKGYAGMDVSWRQKGGDRKRIQYTFNALGYLAEWSMLKYDKKANQYVKDTEARYQYVYNDLSKPLMVEIERKQYHDGRVTKQSFVDSLSYISDGVEIFHMSSERGRFSMTSVTHFEEKDGTSIIVKTGWCEGCSLTKLVYRYNSNGQLIQYRRVTGSDYKSYNQHTQDFKWTGMGNATSKMTHYAYYKPEPELISTQNKTYKFRSDGTLKKCVVRIRNPRICFGLLWSIA